MGNVFGIGSMFAVIISILLFLIPIVIFCVMAVTLYNIRKNTGQISKNTSQIKAIITAKAIKDGLEFYQCPNCDSIYLEKQEQCPNCHVTLK